MWQIVKRHEYYKCCVNNYFAKIHIAAHLKYAVVIINDDAL